MKKIGTKALSKLSFAKRLREKLKAFASSREAKKAASAAPT